MRYALAAAALVSVVPLSAQVQAASLTMLCKNPFRFYSLKFDPQRRKIFANDTEYVVNVVENKPGHVVIAGKTGEGGPTYRAEFAPKHEIRFDFNDGQVDKCR